MAKTQGSKSGDGKFKLSEVSIGGLNQKELTSFTRQFATLQNAGLNTIRSLEILMGMLKPGVLKTAVRKVREDVEQGVTLSDAMSRQPKAFDKLYVNMVKAGEAGGILDEILRRLADFREKSQKIAGEIKSAMIYPVAVVIIATAIVAGIIVYIVPTFEKMFKEMGVKLPATTQLLLEIADIVTNRWYQPLAVVAILLAVIWALRKHPRGLYFVDLAKMYLPIFGTIVRLSAISRFCRTLSTLLDSGVPLVEALAILREAAGNEALGCLIDEIGISVKQGEQMTKPMRNSRIFDEMTIAMIEVGDEAGEVSAMLNKISDNFDNTVDAMVSGMKSLIEPVLIVGLGGAVGFIVISLFMPLIAMMDTLSK